MPSADQMLLNVNVGSLTVIQEEKIDAFNIKPPAGERSGGESSV